jgi:dTDP-glucose pyrophosphorylase
MKEHLDLFLILRTVNLKEAMKKLDVSGRKILFVINEDDTLYGSLTDGDIRRWILSGDSLEHKIEDVCHKNPHTADTSYHISDIKHLMIKENIYAVPILTNNRKVHSILFWDEVFSDSESGPLLRSIEIPVVIMAGGKGTRMEPFTKVLPKPLIPIGDKTILEYIIDEFRKFSVRQFFLTLNFKGAMIKSYFNSDARPYTIEYLWEKDFYGTAGSLSLLKGLIHSDFIVSNCDNIVKADYFDVLNHHRTHDSYVTILSSIQHHKIPYGIVSFKDGGVVTEIIEKPEYSFSINTGIYILSEKALDYIPENKVFHMTNLIEDLMKHHKKVLTYPVNEKDFIDIGEWDEYRKTVDLLRI